MEQKKENVVSRWLKKIFSIQFISLVIAAVGLYFAYDQFVKDKPGEFRFFNKGNRFSPDIRTVFYGFEINGDSIYLDNNMYLPTLANFSQKPIVDLKVVADMQYNFGFRCDDNYNWFKQDESDLQIPKITFVAGTERLGSMTPITFPIRSLETDYDEIQVNYVRMGIVYQGAPEEIMNYFYYLVGIPPKLRDDDGKEKSAEYLFIKAIRPYLLHFLEKEEANKVLIVFNTSSVEAPSKLHLLKDENIEVKSIKELQ